jgi:hypothetical protein
MSHHGRSQGPWGPLRKVNRLLEAAALNRGGDKTIVPGWDGAPASGCADAASVPGRATRWCCSGVCPRLDGFGVTDQWSCRVTVVGRPRRAGAMTILSMSGAYAAGLPKTSEPPAVFSVTGMVFSKKLFHAYV